MGFTGAAQFIAMSGKLLTPLSTGARCDPSYSQDRDITLSC